MTCRALALATAVLLLLLQGCAPADGTAAAVEAADAPAEVSTHAAAPPRMASALGGQRGNGAPYEVVGSEVWNVPDPVSGRDYQLFVALPASYADNPQRRYPVLYVTDADYAFPLVRQIARRLNGEGPAVEDFILVGLSYALGEDGMTSRRRDYTPIPLAAGEAPGGAVHGGGAAYAGYLRDQVIPFVAGRYRSDEQRRVFLGHSYGALLGTQILFSEPGLFSGYLLGSPSYWYGEQHMLGQEKLYAAAHADLPARVYMYVGEYEQRRFGKQMDMVTDARTMTQALRSRGYPSLQLQLDVLPDEDHLSVAPRGFIHGLKHLLGDPAASP